MLQLHLKKSRVQEARAEEQITKVITKSYGGQETGVTCTKRRKPEQEKSDGVEENMIRTISDQKAIKAERSPRRTELICDPISSRLDRGEKVSNKRC